MTWDGRAAGEQEPWWDPEETELLPRTVPAGEWEVSGTDLASTRPLPRIDDASHAPVPPASAPPGGRRPQGRVLRGVWAGAVLAATAVGGIVVGAVMVASADRPRSQTSPEPDTPLPTRTGPVAYEVTVTTANTAGAGTDSDVQVRLTDETGRTSAWTSLDKSGHDDFEAGVRDTYVIAVPADFGRAAALQLWKGGDDAWAVAADVRVVGPDAYAALWRPTEGGDWLWLTGSEPVPGDGAPAYSSYSPNGVLLLDSP